LPSPPFESRKKFPLAGFAGFTPKDTTPTTADDVTPTTTTTTTFFFSQLRRRKTCKAPDP
jgi:hypothetical protein